MSVKEMNLARLTTNLGVDASACEEALLLSAHDDTLAEQLLRSRFASVVCMVAYGRARVCVKTWLPHDLSTTVRINTRWPSMRRLHVWPTVGTKTLSHANRRGSTQAETKLVRWYSFPLAFRRSKS